jgi:hypothetical protein
LSCDSFHDIVMVQFGLDARLQVTE